MLAAAAERNESRFQRGFLGIVKMLFGIGEGKIRGE
jgi:hypothetical protein